MKKINVVQITHDLNLGGLQQVVVNLCRSLDRDRFNLSVLCLRDLGPFAQDVEGLGIPVTLIDQNEAGADYLSFLKIARYLRKNEIDVIHTHNTNPFVDGGIGALVAGVPTRVHTDHARAFPDKWRYMVAERVMSWFFYRVVGCSQHTSENLMKFEKISPAKIVTIPNGIAPEPFDLELDVEAYRKEVGISFAGPVIGLCVRLSEQKGITHLLKAMPAILEAIPDLTLFIGGEGDLEASLKEEVEQLGIGDHVVFGGPRLDVPQLLKVFDAYVLPSLWEGLPMVVLESLAAGVPIIATNVGGNSSAITDGVNGRLVPPGDATAFAEAVIHTLSDPQRGEGYALAGKKVFEESYSARRMAAEYSKLYLREA